MNLGELRDEVAWKLNFNSSAPAQDFDGGAAAPWKRIDSLINAAIRSLWKEVDAECGSESFLSHQIYTWASGSVTFTLPEEISAPRIIAIYDVTGGTRGEPLYFSSRSGPFPIFWSKSDQLSWDVTGPSQTTSVDIEFSKRPDKLTEESQEPSIFPEEHHDAIYWRAAIIGKTDAQDKIPESWLEEDAQARADLIKHFSRPRPRTQGALPQSPYNDAEF